MEDSVIAVILSAAQAGAEIRESFANDALRPRTPLDKKARGEGESFPGFWDGEKSARKVA
jgi:hypothetical protein